MKDQVSGIVKKCNYAIFCISKIRQYIDFKTTTILVTSLIVSKIEYNLELLYNIPQNTLEKVENMLRKCIRLTFKLKKRDPVESYMELAACFRKSKV